MAHVCRGARMCSLVCTYACASVCVCVHAPVYAAHCHAHFPLLHVSYIVVCTCELLSTYVYICKHMFRCVCLCVSRSVYVYTYSAVQFFRIESIHCSCTCVCVCVRCVRILSTATLLHCFLLHVRLCALSVVYTCCSLPQCRLE